MAGRDPAEALANYLNPFGRAVRCVSRSAMLVHDCHHPRDGLTHSFTPAGNQPLVVATVRGDTQFGLMVQQRFRIVPDPRPERGPWRATTLKYHYSLATADGMEIAAYHWHPGEDAFNEPHLHVEGGRGLVARRAHLPTSRVPVEDFIRFVIREFSVAADHNYAAVLGRSRERFLRFRDW